MTSYVIHARAQNELKRRNIRLPAIGGETVGDGIAGDGQGHPHKISHGRFTAAFFLQCLIAIGVQNLRLEEA